MCSERDHRLEYLWSASNQYNVARYLRTALTVTLMMCLVDLSINQIVNINQKMKRKTTQTQEYHRNYSLVIQCIHITTSTWFSL